MTTQVVRTIRDEWNGGFVAEWTITATTATQGFSFILPAGYLPQERWGLGATTLADGRVQLTASDWAANLQAGQSVTVGGVFRGVASSGLGSDGVIAPPPSGGGTPAQALPSLTVADARIAEPLSGTADLGFVLRLSAASAAPVTVTVTTADGTATAGLDYKPVSATITFAPGETVKTVPVSVLADNVPEGPETLFLRVTGVTGATIADGEGLGTILPPGTQFTPGFLSTRGNQIVDAAGTPVKIAGVNWFGMESANYAPHGLWTRGYKDMMDQMKAEGFNAIRLPYADEALDAGRKPTGIDFAKNPDLVGLSPIQVLDRIVDYAGQIGLRIILDHHRNSAGAGTTENGLWYDAAYPEAKMIANWVMLAERYGKNPTVIGADLHNEPHRATWGDGGANDWKAAAERIGNAVLAKAPDWLIFVEGISSFNGDNYWWGGNLLGAKTSPVQLSVPNKLVYSPHDYPNSIYPQLFFQATNFPENLPGLFDKYWGYLFKQDIAPIFLGEFGSKLQDPKDAAWLSKLTAYLSGDFDANGTNDLPAGKLGMSWTWWSWNPNSGDTGGILKDDWLSVNTEKVAALTPLMWGLIGDGNGVPLPPPPPSVPGVTLSGTAGWDTLTGTAGDDTLRGLGGNDILIGKGGKDLLDGGDGFDIALFETGFRGWSRSLQPNGDVVLSKGTDVATLRNIEVARFADGDLVFDITHPVAQVFRLYQAALGRAPDQGGLSLYADMVGSGSNLFRIADILASSPEFQTRFGANLSSADTVTLFYNFALGRAPDAEGLAAWKGALDTGALTKAQILVGFSESAENKARTAPTVQQGLWHVDKEAAEVARLYDTVLQRKPDLAGLTAWKGAIEGGMPLREAAKGFMGSPEFQSKFAGLSNEGFVTLMYQSALRRDPEPEGLKAWTQALNLGMAREELVVGFSESAEHKAFTKPWIMSETPAEYGILFA
jgi:aryl-phospho-beta-D-glucosidase BglC (GH1 family)